MRAIYYKFDSNENFKEVVITDDAAHHLNVVRIKSGESLMLMNGEGVKLTGVVSSVSKKEIIVQIDKKENFLPEHKISLAIAMPKKDAFEDILKLCVELGVSDIYPLTSDFSQYEYAFSDRVQRVLESGLIQSNNPFFPKIHAQNSLDNFLKKHVEALVFFNSRPNTLLAKEDGAGPKTILIGPEGGFSPEEVESILKYPKIHEIHLPTPILRAPTAVAASVGYLLAKYR